MLGATFYTKLLHVSKYVIAQYSCGCAMIWKSAPDIFFGATTFGSSKVKNAIGRIGIPRRWTRRMGHLFCNQNQNDDAL